MKTIAGLMLVMITASGCLNIYAENNKMDSPDNCFSEINLSIVHSWIKEHSRKDNKPFIEFDGYELYAETDMIIIVKEKGYTLARITKENGIYSLAILKSSNDRIVKKTGRIFCRILELAGAGN